MTHDRHLTVYVLWPVLGALGLAVTLGVSVGGVALLASGGDWRTVGTWAGGAFFGVLGVAVLALFCYAAAGWGGPARLARIVRGVYDAAPGDDQEADPPDPEVRFIRLGGRPPKLTAPAPVAPRGDVLDLHPVRTPAGGTRYETTATATHDAPPEHPPWCVEMLDVLRATYPTNALSRRNWEAMFDGGKGLWTRYVRGTGDGRRGRALLDLWGVIDQSGPRHTWRYCHDWQTIVGLDPALLDYARWCGCADTPTGDRGRQGSERVTTIPDRTDAPDQTTREGA